MAGQRVAAKKFVRATPAATVRATAGAHGAVMDTHPILFRTLTDAWHAPHGPAHQPVPEQWTTRHLLLEEFGTLADVVTVCNERGCPARANQVFGALVALAPTDPLATRTALQALLPGLAVICRRVPGYVGPGQLWATTAELDQEVVTLCCERLIDGLAVGSPWPAVRLRDAVWRRVRTLHGVHTRRRARELPVANHPQHPSSTTRVHADEQLVHAVCRAVESGRLHREQASLVLNTRLLDITPAQLAHREGVDVRTIRARRTKAEVRLLAAVA